MGFIKQDSEVYPHFSLLSLDYTRIILTELPNYSANNSYFKFVIGLVCKALVFKHI